VVTETAGFQTVKSEIWQSQAGDDLHAEVETYKITVCEQLA
jgi:hypothetical protein